MGAGPSGVKLQGCATARFSPLLWERFQAVLDLLGQKKWLRVQSLQQDDGRILTAL